VIDWLSNEAQMTKGKIIAAGLMISFRQIDANCRNTRKSTGQITDEGKRRSRGYAIPWLTTETAIGALDDAKDYQAFEAAKQPTLRRCYVLGVMATPSLQPRAQTALS
jgi:hypothetical protein